MWKEITDTNRGGDKVEGVDAGDSSLASNKFIRIHDNCVFFELISLLVYSEVIQFLNSLSM